MTVSAEAERAAQLALLEMAETLQRPLEQVEVLHRLVEVELGAAALEAAESWLERAQAVLDDQEDGDDEDDGGGDTAGDTAMWRQRQDDMRARVAQARANPPGERDAAKGGEVGEAGDQPGAGGLQLGGLQLDMAAVARAERTPSAADQLLVGQPATDIPDAFAYARDGGPPRPERVHYIKLTDDRRLAGAGTVLASIVFILLAALFCVMTVVNLGAGRLLFATIGLVLTLGLGTAAFVTRQRIRLAAADARAERAGDYRLGWYFDGDTLLLRAAGGFSAFPRARVSGARVDSRYDSETNYTRSWLVLCYRDDSDTAVELALEFNFAVSRTAIVASIDKWRLHGRI